MTTFQERPSIRPISNRSNTIQIDPILSLSINSQTVLLLNLSKVPSIFIQETKGFKVGSSLSTKKVGSPNLLSESLTAAPTSFDWTLEGVVTTPKDQGECGSCWAFASVAAAESKLIIDKRYEIDIDLSEQYMLECTRESDCDGGYMDYAMMVALEVPP